MFVRYWADTSDSGLGIAALEYMRSLIKIAPVRVISMSGFMAGRWTGYEALLATPMVGTPINCVCCDPSRWTWVERVPMGDRAVDHQAIRAGGEVEIPPTSEVVDGRLELYTHGIRNVLFALANPRTKPEVATALKYEHIVVSSDAQVSPWISAGARPPHVIPWAPAGLSASDEIVLRRLVST